MILPNVRASFGPRELAFLVGVLGETAAGRQRAAARLADEGIDRLLDDPRTLEAVMGRGVSAAPLELVCYLVVRRALLQVELDDRTLADYLAALLIDFSRADRGVEQAKNFAYLVDVLGEIEQSAVSRVFELHAYLGEYSLWLSGVFPDRIVARVHRRGAPGLGYYEEMGIAGYRTAAEHRRAGDLGLNRLYLDCAERFPELRIALNRVSDRYLFPTAAPTVDRLLRQVASEFRAR
ncbi:MAG TPA: hypothetical protein VMN78_00745 [Longimicrobiales bacterium]|nr:hypothetical protein [Longimicrobiales bacterium]